MDIKMLRSILILVSVILFSGCATSSYNYAPPNIKKVNNQIVVTENFDVVWDRLVKKLSSDFFVINNIEKSSRIINVSFTSSKPSEFVDCGFTTRKFKNARGENTYAYNAADSAQYSITDNNGQAFNAIRTSKLNGRANIYVAPDGNDGTIVSANTKYVVDVTLQMYNFNGQPAGTQTYTYDFSTKTPFETSPTEGATCVAKGNIEEQILGYAK